MRDLTGQSNAVARQKDAHSRQTTIRLLWLLIAASLVLPLILFGVARVMSVLPLIATK
jgi:hypothetical protein